MTRSMTGHGVGSAETAGRRIVVEIRTVNHRFLDLKWRGASLGAAIEDKAGQKVRAALSRGAVSVFVREEGGCSAVPAIDETAARAVYESLERLRQALGLAEPVSLTTVLAQPGVVVAGGRSPADEQGLWELVDAALRSALAELDVMREKEGGALVDDIEQHLRVIEENRVRVAQEVPLAVEEAALRLRERVDKLVSHTKLEVDAQRLATEVALCADRVDVSEEIVRLGSHLAQARELLRSGEPVGRKLEFLSQEMGREINTVGAKSQSASIAKHVMDVKAALEKIREQIQNIE